MSARSGRLRITARVVATYLFVVVLHGLYDFSSNIGALIVALLTGQASHWQQLLEGHVPVQMEHDLALFTAASWLCIGLVSSIGIYAMRRLWRFATAEAQPTAPARALPQ
jgi:Fe2+ transport system protein B